MEVINPSKHSTWVILFLCKTFFINLTSFSLNTSQICKTLPDTSCSLQMVANKKEAPHTHPAVICSIFSSHRLYFPARIMGFSHRRWITKWKKMKMSYPLEASKENGFYFLFMSLHFPCQQYHPEQGLPLPTLVLTNFPLSCALWQPVVCSNRSSFWAVI